MMTLYTLELMWLVLILDPNGLAVFNPIWSICCYHHLYPLDCCLQQCLVGSLWSKLITKSLHSIIPLFNQLVANCDWCLKVKLLYIINYQRIYKLNEENCFHSIIKTYARIKQESEIVTILFLGAMVTNFYDNEFE